jgi:hypothetical protein
LSNLLFGLVELWGLFLLLCIVAFLMKKLDRKVDGQREPCPPHSWECLDQPGMPGVQFMRCRRCQMLPHDFVEEDA